MAGNPPPTSGGPGGDPGTSRTGTSGTSRTGTSCPGRDLALLMMGQLGTVSLVVEQFREMVADSLDILPHPEQFRDVKTYLDRFDRELTAQYVSLAKSLGLAPIVEV